MLPKPTTALRIFRKSLILKIFAICFICVHIPLIAVIAYFASGFGTATAPLVVLMLTATVFGTVLCLLGLWWLIRPLTSLARAVETYQAHGGPLGVRLRREDEIGTLATAVSTMVSEMDGVVKRLHQQATTDPLTGLGNRRWLGDRVNEEISRAVRQRDPLSIILFDLDLFKAINDSHGHDVGDQVLVAAGEVVRTHLRHYDLAARMGGEEFCVVLPRTRIHEADAIAERLRKALAAIDIPPLARGDVTASFGVYQAAEGDGLQKMLLMSDKALYEAKKNGRNRIAHAMAETSERLNLDRKG